MLAGYSEVVAFNQNIQGDEFFYEDDYAFIDEDMVKLPPHLQPHFSIPHPWKNNASFEEDFILISEFSEQEGPKPLISIPTEAGGKFDINAFAVKVMAVDYQMVGSCSFSVAMDTHIVIEDELEGAFAYVHHFTLYDIYARGFVRPFCMAYITPDKKKIMDNFEELLRKFKKVSTYFKYGNRLLFVKDLEHHILDLHYTKDKFLKYKKDENKKEEDDINDSEIGSSTVAEYFTYTTAEHIDHNIKEISNIYNIVKPLMTNKKLESRFKRLEDKARDTKSCCLHSATRISLREDGYHSDGPTTPSTPSKRNSIPECCCAVDAIYQPKLVKTDSTRRFDKALRTLHELCNWGAKEGLNRLRKIHKCHSRDPITVRVESQESDLIDPPSTLLTIGRSVVINFLHNIDLSGSTSCWPLYEVCRSKLRCNSLNERKWFAEQHENISLCSSDTVDSYISYSEDGTDRLPQSSYDAAFVLGSAFVSLESLYYDVAESPYSDTSESESDIITTSSDSPTYGPTLLNDSMVNLLEIEDQLKSKEDEVFLSSGSVKDVDNDIVCTNHSLGKNISDDEMAEMVDSVCCDHSSVESAQELTKGTELTDSSLIKDIQKPNRREKNKGILTVVTEDTAPLSHIEPSERYPRIPVGSCADHICRFNANLPGAGIVKFVHHYEFSVHIIYALLSGRPVVILGSPRYEKEVRSLITTLWLFVPGHSNRYHVVVPWHSDPLTLKDLGRMKLVGLSKSRSSRSSNVLPSSVRRYVSVLDYDKSLLYSPSYKGVYIESLVNKKKQFRSDETFIAHIHSVLLQLASKSYLYYHSYCLNSTSNKDAQFSSTNHQAGKKTMASFLGVTDGDADIVKYWVELIKQQQVDDFIARINGYSNHDQLPSPPVRIDFRQSREYAV